MCSSKSEPFVISGVILDADVEEDADNIVLLEDAEDENDVRHELKDVLIVFPSLR